MTKNEVKIDNVVKLLKTNFIDFSICKINDYYLTHYSFTFKTNLPILSPLNKRKKVS